MSKTEETQELEQRQEKIKENVKQIIQPMHVIAPLAVIATAYAYFLGWSYFYGLFGTAGVEWVMRDISALETMTAPLYLLTITATLSLLFFGLFFEGIIKLKGLMWLFIFMCSAAAIFALIHFCVEYWWANRYESHWLAGTFVSMICALTILPALMISNSVEGYLSVSAQMSFLYLSLGLVLVPFLARSTGELVAKKQVFREESKLSRVKLSSIQGCNWRLFRTLNNGDYLLVLPRKDQDLKPTFRIVKSENIVRIMDSSNKECASI